MPLQDLSPQLRTRLNKMERAVGWFVFIAAALLLFGFGYYIYHTAERKGWFLIKAHFFTYVQSSSGLNVGDPVVMMGFPVGQITLIRAMPPGDQHNVRVEFEVKDDYFRYIRSKGSFVKVNGGFLGQSQLEVTRGTNGGYALAVTQPVFHKTIDELKRLVITESNRWQLSQYVFNSQSNAVFIPYQPYDGLTPSSLDQLASLNLESNSVYAYDNQLESKHIVATWREDLKRYDFYDDKKNGPIELPALDSVPVADRLDRIVGQVENAIPGILALTNQLTTILNNAVVATSNLNTTLASANNVMVAAQPVVTNLNTFLANTDTNLGALLINLADITGNLSVQVRANSNLLSGIYKTVVDADDLVQGLKKNWLLRSSFKTNQPPTKKR